MKTFWSPPNCPDAHSSNQVSFPLSTSDFCVIQLNFVLFGKNSLWERLPRVAQ